MKYVYIFDNKAHEIIQDIDPAFPGIPVDQRYAEDFLKQCVAVADDTVVESGWDYDPISEIFSEPVPMVPDEPSADAQSDAIGDTVDVEEVDDDV